MRRHRTLAVLAVLVAACSPTVQSPTLRTTPPLPGDVLTPEPLPTAHGSDPASICDFAVKYPGGPASTDDYGDTYQPAGGPQGGSLTVATLDPIDGFDPIASVTGGEALLSAAVWRGLTRQSSDYRVVPDLARVVPQVTNGLVTLRPDGHGMSVTWCLRSGLAWSDGRPLTCADFQYTLRWLDEVRPFAVARFGDPVAVDCPRDTIMVIRYDRIFGSYYARALPPLPEHALESGRYVGFRAGAQLSPGELVDLPTSGPFRFEAVQPTRRYDLVRNDYYRSPALGQPARLDRMTILKLASSADAIATFESGRADLVEGLDPADIAALQSARLDESIIAVPGLEADTLRLNLSATEATDGSGGCSSSPAVASRGPGCPIADLGLRQAIRAALDARAIAQDLAPERGEQVWNSIVAPQVWFFADLPVPATDAATARRLLAADGWVDRDGDGVVERDGTSARIELCLTATPGHLAAGGLIESELAAIGIRVIPHAVTANVLDAPYASTPRRAPCAVSRSNFDMALTHVASSLEPVDFEMTYGSRFFEPAGRNDGRIALPAIDEALDTAVASVDFAKVKDAMVRFQQAAVDNVVEIPLGSRKHIALIAVNDGANAFGNYFATASGTDTWNAEDWFLVQPPSPASPTAP